ncbi:MAG: energy-coupling factor transporter transmembrane protein EcfT [Spirochaetales bacterium]|nr:energy-coupling factor transporter transmembrane protein EcfT [Spirochaetales bacterium]
MAYNITLFHYFPGDSFLHRSDPGFKLIIVLFFCILVFILNFPAILIVLSAEIVFVILAKLRIRRLLSELSRFFIFLLIIFLFRAYSSDTIITFAGKIPLPSLNGFGSGGFIILRLSMVIFWGVFLTSTTKVEELQNALFIFFLKIPFFPAARVAMLVSLTIASIPLLLDKVNEVDEARKARCIQKNKNPMYHITTFALPLLIHVIQQSDDIAMAMEARCYRENRKPISKSLQKRDYCILLFSLLIGLLSLWLN